MRWYLIILLSGLFAQAQTAFADSLHVFREWTDNTGTFSVRAKLVPDRTHGREVTLLLESGKTVTLPLRRLSANDRRFLTLQPEPELPQLPQPRLVNGIPWQSTLDDAATAAAAGPTTDDDRPILCFRALGDLSGFM